MKVARSLFQTKYMDLRACLQGRKRRLAAVENIPYYENVQISPHFCRIKSLIRFQTKESQILRELAGTSIFPAIFEMTRSDP